MPSASPAAPATPRRTGSLSLLTDGETMLRVEGRAGLPRRARRLVPHPIAGLAEIRRPDLDRVTFRGLIISPDGTTVHTTQRTGKPEQAVAMARDAGEELKAVAGPGFFTAIKG